MKKLITILLLIVILLLSACDKSPVDYDIVATTLPVYDMTLALCEGTDLCVGRLITENVSCLHDYTLQVDQMKMIEGANALIISGAGLEDFLHDAMKNVPYIVDASVGTHMHSVDHPHDHEHHSDHSHENDPHIWLSPENASIMAANICDELALMYPAWQDTFAVNLTNLQKRLDLLQTYGEETLSTLPVTELITFHDGFAYFAESFGLTILEAIEEESGSEASAEEIIHLVELIDGHEIPAVFIEKSGSDACAGIIHAETGVKIFTLDMAMSGNSYFEAMYHNIDTVKEALG